MTKKKKEDTRSLISRAMKRTGARLRLRGSTSSSSLTTGSYRCVDLTAPAVSQSSLVTLLSAAILFGSSKMLKMLLKERAQGFTIFYSV